MTSPHRLMVGLVFAGFLVACGKKAPEAGEIDAAPSAPPLPPASVSAQASVAAEPPKQPPPVVNTAAGEAALKACCAALRTEAPKATPQDKRSYEAAAGVCDGLVPKVKSGVVNSDSAKLTVRAQIQRTRAIPGACR